MTTKTLYHATNSDYDEFDLAYTSSQMGIHLGTIDQANDVVQSHLNNEEENIFFLKVECSFKNTIRLEDFGGWQSFQLVLSINEITGSKLNTSASSHSIRNHLIRLGYDSVVYSNDFEGEGDSYISLIPQKQTKIISKKLVEDIVDPLDFLINKTKNTQCISHKNNF
jgi:hypothetical protein